MSMHHSKYFNILFDETSSEKLYAAIHKVIQDDFGSYFFSVCYLEQDESYFYVDYSNSIGEQFCSKPFFLFNTPLIKKCYTYGKPSYIENSDEGDFVEIDSSCFTFINACFPLIFRGRLLGFFLFQDEESNYDFRDERNAEAVTAFLEIAACALVSVKRIEEEGRKNHLQQVKLNCIEFLSGLVEPIDGNLIAVRLLQHIVDLLHGEVGAIHRLEKGEAHPIVELGLPFEFISQVKYAGGDFILNHVLHEKAPFYSAIGKNKQRVFIESNDVLLKNIALIPLTVDDETVGILSAVNYNDETSEEIFTVINNCVQFCAQAYATVNDNSLTPQQKANKLRKRFFLSLSHLF